VDDLCVTLIGGPRPLQDCFAFDSPATSSPEEACSQARLSSACTSSRERRRTGANVFEAWTEATATEEVAPEEDAEEEAIAPKEADTSEAPAFADEEAFVTTVAVARGAAAAAETPPAGLRSLQTPQKRLQDGLADRCIHEGWVGCHA
jgi:hypothetical protein